MDAWGTTLPAGHCGVPKYACAASESRPHPEVLAAGDAPAGVIAIAFALQRQAESIHEQLAALRRVSGDRRHARDEENVHLAQLTESFSNVG
jgi:hypothetical protein